MRVTDLIMTGAEAIIESLKNENIDVVFGYPGGAVLTLYDALYQADFRHILTKHEQGSVHAADGYARATGKVGVVIATSGPGATNLITGIATAYMDSIPLVAITGQVSVPLIGRDSFQEAEEHLKKPFILREQEDRALWLLILLKMSLQLLLITNIPMRLSCVAIALYMMEMLK